jgi:hypothetical protein
MWVRERVSSALTRGRARRYALARWHRTREGSRKTFCHDVLSVPY